MKKRKQLTIEELERKGGLLKKAQVICAISSIVLLVSLMISSFVYIFTQDKKHDYNKFVKNNTGYSIVADEDYNKQVALLEEKIYNKEIPIKDYQEELKKIKRMSIEEYFENHATAEEKEAYAQLLKEIDKNSTTAAALLSGGIAAGGAGCISTGLLSVAYDSVKQEKTRREEEGFFFQDSEL